MNYFIRLLLSALAVLLLSYFLPGVFVNSIPTALLVAFILSLLNGLVKPILILLTLPVTLATLGLFLLVINAALILLADQLVSGFYVNGFWNALLFSILLSLTQSLLYAFRPEQPK